MSRERFEGDFFNVGVVSIFAALSGRTFEEECQSLLDQEKEMWEMGKL